MAGGERETLSAARPTFTSSRRDSRATIKADLEAAGGTFYHVIKLNSYLMTLSHLSGFREVRDKYINLGAPPASTAVQVSRLFRPEFLVEIEAVAVVAK
jgi:enamine deaminase RidA (YjgF/YER057c/UK114 family)